MDVFDPLDKDKTWIQWYYTANCFPGRAQWRTRADDDDKGFIGGCGETGDFECDDGKVEWQAYGTGWERYFDCRVRGGL